MDVGNSDDAGSADDALYLEEVDEYEYEGRLGGFLSERSVFYLRLYPDGELDGLVRQRRKPQLNGLAVLSTSKKRKLASDADEAAQSLEATDGTMVCGHLKGRWLRRGDGHVCHFKAMKRLGHADRHTLSCRAELWKSGAASGEWRVYDGVEMKKESADHGEVQQDEGEDDDTVTEGEDDDECGVENVFAWKRVERNSSGAVTNDASSVHSQDPLALYPLTPGTYHFRGFTTYKTPETPRRPSPQSAKKPRQTNKAKKKEPRDECFVTMELLPDGTLRGKSREVVYPQSCPIRGTWEIGRVRYVLEYKVREAVGFFKYSARVTSTGDDHDEDAGGGGRRDEASARALRGKWRNVDDGGAATPGYTAGRGQFGLVCVHRSSLVTVQAEMKVEEAELGIAGAKQEAGADYDDDCVLAVGLLTVFTTGTYVLKGKAIDEDGYEYESQLQVELFADGTLRGTCQELVFQQIQRLRGKWTKTTVEYELEYAVNQEVGRYWYQGKLDGEGLVVHGEWCNMDLLLESKQDPSVSYRGEQGTFSYAIIESMRRWSHTSHGDFPKSFRDRIRCILLCSQRAHVLPSALWGKIFAFCGHDWFHTALFKVKDE